ncbi:MAG: MarR family transcriptional regulator [bacterium]|nr:MarR family transcriptional regulator [bacterium]
MDLERTTEGYAGLFSAAYQLLHRRRDPRGYRPSGETLAVLYHLADSGPLTIDEAARHFDRSQSAISERIARMTERGLLTRIRDERDRRRHLVWLSEEGEELLRVEREVLSAESLTGALEEMSGDDRRALIQGTTALVEAARTMASRHARGSE